MKTLAPVALLALCCAVTGCNDPALRLHLSTQAAGGQLAYGAPTLAAAKRGFFGEDEGGEGDIGGGTSDLLSPADPVALQGNPPTVTQLALSRANDIGGVTLTTSLQAGYQHLHGTLPQGFGMLTDPIDLQMWARSVGVEMTLGRAMALPGGLRLHYAAGAGVAQVTAATHLQSALLDLRGHSRQTLPYALLQARLGGSAGPSVQGDLMLFQSGARELRLGLMQSF